MRNSIAAIAIVGIWIGVGTTGLFSLVNVEGVAVAEMIATIAVGGLLSEKL